MPHHHYRAPGQMWRQRKTYRKHTEKTILLLNLKLKQNDVYQLSFKALSEFLVDSEGKQIMTHFCEIPTPKSVVKMPSIESNSSKQLTRIHH